MEGLVGTGTDSDLVFLLLVGLPFDFSVDDREEALSLSDYNDRFQDIRLHQQSLLLICLVSPKTLCFTKNREGIACHIWGLRLCHAS